MDHGFYAVTLLKYSQIRQDLLRFVPRTPKNPQVTKFYDLKGAIFCVDFGEAKLIRLTPMSANEPKAAEKPPFKADSGLNALAIFVRVLVLSLRECPLRFQYQPRV